ncbi:phosphate ABC transporter membrane protein 1, PhoT family [Pyrobaculum sp. WP30]|nr:phosphate ABC transporter membrane protein 1, PhoT family [Pyrobaculum sp. WP30]
MLGFLLVVLLIPYLIAAYGLLFVKLRWGLRLFGAFIVATIGLLTVMFLVEAYPIIARDGVAVFLQTGWDPVRESYGVLQALTGTVLTSAVAMALAMPMALGVAVTINEILPARWRGVFGSLVDLTATMPTVIYGLWGLFVLGPTLQSLVNTLARDTMTSPYTLFTAGVLLAIMITPYAAAVIREGYALVPKPVEEAIYAVGATRFEAALIKLRYVRNYILGGFFLALGRAMGETVAVAMVVGGNFVRFTTNIFESGITISSLIALQFPNAASYQYMVPALFAGALLLTLFGLAINAVAIYIIQRGQI